MDVARWDCAFRSAAERAKLSSPVAPNGNYDAHYSAILDWFEAVPSKGWTPQKVIQGSLMVYGWMPTLLEGRKSRASIDPSVPGRFAGRLNSASQHPRTLDKTAWNWINASFVGTSKFLHFWRPNHFGIWDINVARALVVRESEALKLRHNQIDKLFLVEKYQTKIREFAQGKSGPDIRQIEKQLFREGQCISLQNGKGKCPS